MIKKHMSIFKVFKPLTWGISFQLNITIYSDHTLATEDTGTTTYLSYLDFFFNFHLISNTQVK